MVDSIKSDGIEPHDTTIEYIPKNPIELNDEDYELAEKLTGLLHDISDVENVYVSYKQRAEGESESS